VFTWFRFEWGCNLSETEKLSVEELIERYKQARKVRRKYAIKQFLKIKRGAVGVVILITLTTLSLMSSIIAPEPNEFKHAPLSKPAWLRVFDPYAIGDFNLSEINFDSSECIATGLEEAEIDVGKVYEEHNISAFPSLKFEGLYYDESDGKFDPGCGVIRITDITSEEVPEKGRAIISYNFKVKWDKDVVPYAVYFWFAHKFVIDLPPIMDETVEVGPYGAITLNVSYSGSVLPGTKFNFTIVDPEEGDVVRAIVKAGEETRLNKTVKWNAPLIEKINLSNDTKVIIKNLVDRKLKVSVTIEVASGNIYPTKFNIYLNLWNKYYDREMTPEELDAYLREFGVAAPKKELTDSGLLVFPEVSFAGDWVTFGYPSKTFLTAREVYQEPFFQKDNIIIVKIEANMTIMSSYANLRPVFGDKINISWYIDNMVIEIQDKYYGLMGTDKNGRDIFAMIVDGLKISLLVGFIATFANIAIGVTLGLVSGYVGGKTDEVVMRFVDFFMSIPGLPLLMVLSFVFYSMNVDPLIAIIVVLSIFGWAGMARTVRSQVLALRANIYVEAARASGASSFYIIRKHILPGVWPLVLMYLMTGVVGNILAEAGLSFLGILRPNWNSLGKMIQEAAGISAATGGGAGGLGMKAIHWVFFPGFILMLIGYAFYAIGDAYDELINPKRRKRF